MDKLYNNNKSGGNHSNQSNHGTHSNHNLFHEYDKLMIFEPSLKQKASKTKWAAGDAMDDSATPVTRFRSERSLASAA